MTSALDALPCAHGAPPATGRIRTRPEDFLVLEGLGFPPDGEGAHALLEVEKRDANTGWVAAHGQLMVNANPALDLMGPVGDVHVPMSSALVVPFAAGGGRGAMAFYADAADAFTLDDARVATAAAAALSRAFRLATSSRSKTQAA